MRAAPRRGAGWWARIVVTAALVGAGFVVATAALMAYSTVSSAEELQRICRDSGVLASGNEFCGQAVQVLAPGSRLALWTLFVEKVDRIVSGVTARVFDFLTNGRLLATLGLAFVSRLAMPARDRVVAWAADRVVRRRALTIKDNTRAAAHSDDED